MKAKIYKDKKGNEIRYGDCLFIQSSEGLTEDELLQIISEELLN